MVRRGVRLRVMQGVSRWVWDFAGVSLYHSRLEGMWRDQIKGRWAINASQRRKINPKRAMKDIADPTEETAFH